MKFFERLKDWWADIKIYLDRGKTHYGTISVASTAIILVGVYKDTPIGKWIFENYAIAMPLAVS